MRGMESAGSSEKAIKYFQQAIEKDPTYAVAYSALSGVYSIWISWDDSLSTQPHAEGQGIRAEGSDPG
jgi:tetratricopeptide (TPR) repeat protein